MEADKKRMLLVTVLRASGFTLQEIGETLNLTRERVRQIESQAKTHLPFPDVARTIGNLARFIEDLTGSNGGV